MDERDLDDSKLDDFNKDPKKAIPFISDEVEEDDEGDDEPEEGGEKEDDDDVEEDDDDEENGLI